MAAKKVFGGVDPVGQYVTIRGQDFQVIGLLQLKIQDSSNNGPDNQNVFVPFETYRDLMDIRDPSMIVFAPINPALHKKALEGVRAVLARRHHFDPKDDKATPEWDTVEDAQEIAQFSFALQIVLGLIGALTLGVGGVGVMNIMLVSVTERTKEIGLRKAVGATRSNILSQFLIEAVVLTAIGGLIGLAVGELCGFLVNKYSPLPAYVPPWAIAVGVGISAAIGIIFGLWPAWKAARLDPIESLRWE
jgi:putative ABC transport system permease protein